MAPFLYILSHYLQQSISKVILICYVATINVIHLLRHKKRLTSVILRLNKGKTVPSQAWSGPEGSRKLGFPDFMTTAQNGGKVVSLTHRPPLPPGNTPGTHFC